MRPAMVSGAAGRVCDSRTVPVMPAGDEHADSNNEGCATTLRGPHGVELQSGGFTMTDLHGREVAVTLDPRERAALVVAMLTSWHPEATGDRLWPAKALEPLPMVLHCPACGTQHIDKPEPDKGWANPPHKSHLCRACGVIWRPADVPTVGVEAASTRGKVDTWPKATPRVPTVASYDDSGVPGYRPPGK